MPYPAGITVNSLTWLNRLETSVPRTLDWQLALRQSANKEMLARDLLQMLVNFLPQVSERVNAIGQGKPITISFILESINCTAVVATAASRD